MKKSVAFVPENSLALQCYEQLEQEIVQGVLLPGEKLKVMPIAERFGIGQSPVREALSKLSAFGLVQVEENKGFTVAKVTESDIRDTYKVFTILETTALQWAMKCGDMSWQAHIVGQLHKLSMIENSEKIAPQSVWQQANYDFHLALIAGCNSPILLEMRKHIYMKFDRYCQLSYQLSKQMQHKNHACHQELAQAVLQGDATLAKKLMVHHINDPLEMVVEQFKQCNVF
jgi:GntR family transcriptional regulator, carbon starvation induced regulator